MPTLQLLLRVWETLVTDIREQTTIKESGQADSAASNEASFGNGTDYCQYRHKWVNERQT